MAKRKKSSPSRRHAHASPVVNHAKSSMVPTLVGVIVLVIVALIVMSWVSKHPVEQNTSYTADQLPTISDDDSVEMLEQEVQILESMSSAAEY